jgi:TolB protein
VGALAIGLVGSGAADAAVRLDNARLVPITGLRGSLQNPCFSPNGSQLAITLWPRRYNEGIASVRVVRRTGGPPLARISAPRSTSVNMPGTCWNAARNEIAFSAETDKPDAVFAAGPTGLNRRPIFGADRTVSIEPTWSPDGRFLTYESSIFDAEGPGSIWVVAAEGTGAHRIATGGNDRQPNWSPKGDRIVFQRLSRGQWDLYTVRPDGTGLRNVTRTHAFDETDVSWSPSGRYLVFSAGGPGIDIAQLYVIPSTGGRRVRVTHTDGWYDGAPAWSPDGRTIAFESRIGEPDESSGTRIRTIRAPRGMR